MSRRGRSKSHTNSASRRARQTRNSRPRSVQSKSVEVPKVLSIENVLASFPAKLRLAESMETHSTTNSSSLSSYNDYKHMAVMLERQLVERSNWPVLCALVRHYLVNVHKTDVQLSLFRLGLTDTLLHSGTMTGVMRCLLNHEIRRYDDDDDDDDEGGGDGGDGKNDLRLLFDNKHSAFRTMMRGLWERGKCLQYVKRVTNAIVKMIERKQGDAHKWACLLVRGVIDDIDELPETIRRVLAVLYEVTSLKYLCARLLFSDYIVEALQEPLKYGLLPYVKTRIIAGLLEVSKILQSAVSSLASDTGPPDSAMAGLVEHIKDCIGTCALLDQDDHALQFAGRSLVDFRATKSCQMLGSYSGSMGILEDGDDDDDACDDSSEEAAAVSTSNSSRLIPKRSRSSIGGLKRLSPRRRAYRRSSLGSSTSNLNALNGAKASPLRSSTASAAAMTKNNNKSKSLGPAELATVLEPAVQLRVIVFKTLFQSRALLEEDEEELGGSWATLRKSVALYV